MPFITRGKTDLKYLLIVSVSAIIAGGGILVYQYWWLPKHEPKPSEITIKSKIAGWQTYRNEELGISFKYPPNWNTLQLEKSGHFIKGLPGVSFQGGQDKILISILSKDFVPYDFYALNSKKVDVNWSASEFASNMGIYDADVLFIKKLNDKSMLIAVYESPECSPGMWLRVITPLSDAYPNFVINVGSNGSNNIEDDPDIKAEIDKQIAETGVACNLRDGYKKVVDRMLKGVYSDELNKNIEIARLIADSLTLTQLQATEDWQTYQNDEYGYEIKYPSDWYLEEATIRITIIRPWQHKEGEYSDPTRDLVIRVLPGETVEEYPSENNLAPSSYEDIGNVVIGNYIGKAIHHIAERGYSYRIILIEHSNKLYDFHFFERHTQIAVINQILSTFQFLE